jgi:hypothetical protein
MDSTARQRQPLFAFTADALLVDFSSCRSSHSISRSKLHLPCDLFALEVIATPSGIGSKGQDKAKIFGSEICLVRMRNDRRIEQCHGFNGIFSGEKCSD